MEILSVENNILGLWHIHRTEYFVDISPIPPPQKTAVTLSLHTEDLLTIKVEIVRGEGRGDHTV